MKAITILMCVVLTGAVCSVARAQDVEQARSDRAITPLRNDLYQVRDGQQYTIFLVTPDGIVLGDPLRRDTALWLKGELDARFPQRPVRFVLLSHHHVERAEGASAFRDTAQVVGNRAFNSELNASRLLMQDAYRFVPNVNTTFDSRRTITLGGRSVELVSTEGLHTADMTVMYFPAERVAFVVDPPQITTVPFSFGPDRPRDVFNWIHTVSSLEFDTLLTGAGDTIARSEFIQLRDYLDSVRDGVAAGYEAGDTATQLQASSFLDAHAGNPHYAARDIHVALVYRTLRLIRAEVSGSFIAQYEGRNPREYCGSYTFCSAGGAISGGIGSAALLFGPHFGVVLELSYGDQSWSSRRRESFYEEVALRRARGAVLFRYTPLRPQLGGLSYALLGGVSYTVGDVRGMDYVPGVVVPVGGFHAIEEQSGRTGATLGVDLRQRLGRRLTIVAPVRATQLLGRSPGYWPGLADLQVGVGLAMQVMRRVD
jgi:glyoxylase-like metal-dependent hydrolase (beta-lactamase superfamily II)